MYSRSLWFTVARSTATDHIPAPVGLKGTLCGVRSSAVETRASRNRLGDDGFILSLTSDLDLFFVAFGILCSLVSGWMEQAVKAGEVDGLAWHGAGIEPM